MGCVFYIHSSFIEEEMEAQQEFFFCQISKFALFQTFALNPYAIYLDLNQTGISRNMDD